MQEYSLFEYLYRDASNYKAYGTLLLSGCVGEADKQVIRQACESEEFFVAEQVNVPPLYAELWGFSAGPSVDDHAFHQFLDIRLAEPDEVANHTVWGRLSEFIAAFRELDSQWNCELSVHACV